MAKNEVEMTVKVDIEEVVKLRCHMKECAYNVETPGRGNTCNLKRILLTHDGRCEMLTLDGDQVQKI